ncbi:hypothetical protein AAULH_09013, partial [Lactobacillus helveticus MTCC 5463]
GLSTFIQIRLAIPAQGLPTRVSIRGIDKACLGKAALQMMA